MMRSSWVLQACIAAALLAGCSPSAPEGGTDLRSDVQESLVSEALGGLKSVPDRTGQEPLHAIDEETADYHLKFVIPGQASNIPELQSWFETRMEQVREDLIAETALARADMEGAGFPFRPYDFEEHWVAVADLQDWLSLYASTYLYSGVAHGMNYFGALVWDRREAAMLNPEEMFVSLEALSSVVRTDFCKEIDRQRAEKRQIPVSEVAQFELFGQCIDIDSATLVPVSEQGNGFDHIGFLIQPYEAGPYSEGSYEFSLPVTAAIMAVVKPEYQHAFVVLP